MQNVEYYREYDNLMKHSVTNYWLIFTFCPKILGDGRDLQIMLCHSMNAG